MSSFLQFTLNRCLMRVSESNKVVRYYHRTKNSGANGSYIPVKNLKLAKALAQKDYDRKIVAALK